MSKIAYNGYMSEKKPFLGVKKFRERMNFKQNQLAELLNISSVSYNNYELGRRDASFDVYKKLLELGATVEELFDVPYSAKPPRAELKVSREEAIEIVRVGMQGLIGNGKIFQNGNVLK